MKIRLVMKSVLENNYPGKTPEEIAKELMQTPAFSVIHHTMRDDLGRLAVTSIIQQMLSDGQITLTNDFDKKFETDKFDLGTNRKVAGLMGSTCYMADDFEKLYQKTEENILRIASLVEQNGHHSTFGHSHLTLEISGLPKALAMVLNNEKEYCTSEKSARYTIMKDIEPKQQALYDKWKEIFKGKIDKVYGKCQPFFDKDGKKSTKLAQENARYMLSVFTPTNMVYTTSFRQLNYLYHWMQKEIENPSNSFYKQLIPAMKEFSAWCESKNLISNYLVDGKGRSFSLFGEPNIEKTWSNTYQDDYMASFACLAQLHRHRSINYSIDNSSFKNNFAENNSYFVPPILKDDEKLVKAYLKDIASVGESLPQGTLVHISEQGDIDSFLLKARERNCTMAQLEIANLTFAQTKEYHSSLDKKYQEFVKENNPNAQIVKEMANRLEPLTHGARCTAGYNCASPCAFADGIKMERLV